MKILCVQVDLDPSSPPREHRPHKDCSEAREDDHHRTTSHMAHTKWRRMGSCRSATQGSHSCRYVWVRGVYVWVCVCVCVCVCGSVSRCIWLYYPQTPNTMLKASNRKLEDLILAGNKSLRIILDKSRFQREGATKIFFLEIPDVKKFSVKHFSDISDFHRHWFFRILLFRVARKFSSLQSKSNSFV